MNKINKITKISINKRSYQFHTARISYSPYFKQEYLGKLLELAHKNWKAWGLEKELVNIRND